MKRLVSGKPDLYRESFAGENDTDQGHQDKLDRYGKAKAHQVAVGEYIKDDPLFRKEYQALLECGDFLHFRHWESLGLYRLIGGCSCKKHLLCCLCALRRSARQVQEYEAKIKQLLVEHPDWVPVLITRTIKNGPDLDERYKHFIGAHKKLMRRRRNALSAKKIRLKDCSVLRHVHGSAGSYEFKLGKNSGMWHPHSHEIALLDSSVVFQEEERKGKVVQVPVEFEEQLAEEWFQATGDSYIVDVRRLEVGSEDFLKGVCEAFKYALKFTDLEIPDQVEAYRVLKGRRLVYSYGALWGVKVSDSIVDTVEEFLELVPYVDYVYRFAEGQYKLHEITDHGPLEKGKGLNIKNHDSGLKDIFEINGQCHDLQSIKDWLQGEVVPF